MWPSEHNPIKGQIYLISSTCHPDEDWGRSFGHFLLVSKINSVLSDPIDRGSPNPGMTSCRRLLTLVRVK